METYYLIKQGGRFDLRPLINWLATASDGTFRIEITRVRKRRTLNQNAWLWGCIYPLLRQGLIAAGWDDIATDEQVHEFFKQQFASDSVVNRQTGEVVRLPSSTKEMDTAQFSAYCEKLRDYGREFLGVEIPDPIGF